jgi:hypothetical protein
LEVVTFSFIYLLFFIVVKCCFLSRFNPKASDTVSSAFFIFGAPEAAKKK